MGDARKKTTDKGDQPMAKNHRGKGIKTLPARGRGNCPVCNRTGIKITHEVKVGDKTHKVCKNCKGIAVSRLPV